MLVRRKLWSIHPWLDSAFSKICGRAMKTSTFIFFRKFNGILRGGKYGIPHSADGLNKRTLPTWGVRAMTLTVTNKIGLNLFLDDT